MHSPIARAKARLRACWRGSVCVQAWLIVALRACGRGSARVRAWLCARASAALRACLLGSVHAPAQLCACASTCALQPIHIAKGPRPHVPPADQIVCPPPLFVPLLLSLSLSSTPCFPSFLPCQVRGCCHILCPTGPLVRAFRLGRPRSSLR
jgi:hypothetical protein